jgi:hypothetical protein
MMGRQGPDEPDELEFDEEAGGVLDAVGWFVFEAGGVD